MKRLIAIMAGVGVFVLGASALEINVTPGSLQSKETLLKNPGDSKLVLKGEANVTDLLILGNISRSVTELDMSELSISPYTYETGGYMGKSSFAEGELPPYMLLSSSIQAVKLPANTKIIGRSALSAGAFESIEVPQTVLKVEDYAFSENKRLKNVTFNGNPELGKGLFKNCIELTSVSFGNSIAEIPDYTFDGCASYSESLPSTVNKVGDYSFRGTGYDKLALNRLTSIGDFAFAEIKDLNELSLSGSSDLSIGKGAFFNIGGLDAMPDQLMIYSRLMFAQANVLNRNVYKAEIIDEGAFANNAVIDMITLGENVSKIKRHAFRNLSSLTMVDVKILGSKTPEVDREAFSGLLNDEGRYDIKLNVAPGTESVWAEHPVWGLFEITKEDSGIDNAMVDDSKIMIGRNSETITVISDVYIDFVGIYTVSGMTLVETSPASDMFEMSDLPDDTVLVVKVISGGVTKIAKLR